MCDVMTQEDAMKMNNEQAIQILKPLRDMMFDQHGCPISSAVFALDKAIEALSTEPKTGTWMPMIDSDPLTGEPMEWGVYCSECHYMSGYVTRFCPDCGRLMNGGE